MTIIESIREEVEARVQAAHNTIISRVLSMQVSAEKDRICKHVGYRHYDSSGTAYGRLLTRLLEIKLQLRRLGYRENNTTASLVYDLDNGQRRAMLICHLLDEREKLAPQCEAAKKDLFYGYE